ncbi:MAG: site-specific integrase [Flavobacteriaceae bacterium]|nr:site-specific integrase [Flavobacteriaceae bacterium]
MKFNVLFLINKQKINKKGLCSILCRITYNKSRKVFSIGSFVHPKYWDNKHQKISDHPDYSDFTNTQLNLIRQKLNQAFLFLQVQEVDFDVIDIYKKYKGELPKNQMTLLGYYKLHNEKMKSLIGIDIVEVTFKKYLETEAHVVRFIKNKYNRSDMKLNALKTRFLEDLSYYLKTERKLQQSTVNKTIQRLRKVVKDAVKEDYLVKDPFISYKYKTVKKEIVFLTKEELKRLEEFDFRIDRLNQIRDCFVFCCYTGLAYKEMARLRPNHIVIRHGNMEWIKMKRQKTNSELSIPLLSKTKEILEKYDNKLPIVSNQRFNGYLKEIAYLTAIDKNLTHHIARKTFATTVLLLNGVSIEVTSKLLGHSRIGITQNFYGEILQEAVIREIEKLVK